MNKKISEMDKVTVLDGDAVIPIIQNNTNKAVTVSLIRKGLATETFVTEKIGEIDIPVIPEGLATETFVTEKIGEIDIPVIPVGLATETFVTEKIGEIKHPSLPEGLATETFVIDKIKEIPSSGTVLLFDTDALINMYDATTEEQICGYLGKTKDQIKTMVRNILNEKYDRIEIRFNQGGPYYYNSPISIYCAEENTGDFYCTFNFIWYDNFYSITLNCFSDVLSINRISDKILTKADVIDKLDSNQWALPLSATQGKVLNETKANKTDVYTKAEIDALLAAINNQPTT